jgi:hypothetical protein
VPAPVAEAAFLCLQLVAAGFPLPVPGATAATSGLMLLPPLALTQSQEKTACLLCSLIDADWSLDFLGPFELWYAYTQLPLDDLKSIAPLDQPLQFEPTICQHVVCKSALGYSHRTLAVMTPSFTPDPSSNVTCAALLKLGVVYPLAVRGESVTLVLSEFVYTKNMFELVIDFPWPKATHSYMLGADIWKNMSPLPDVAVLSGMLSLKQTPVEGQILASWAQTLAASSC